MPKGCNEKRGRPGARGAKDPGSGPQWVPTNGSAWGFSGPVPVRGRVGGRNPGGRGSAIKKRLNPNKFPLKRLKND
jgi:hypothetical protein